MTPDIIIAVSELGYGGATAAVLDNARLFHEAGHRVTIATFSADAGTERRTEDIRSRGLIPQAVAIRNLHVEARGTRTPRRQSSWARTRLRDLIDRVRLIGCRVNERTGYNEHIVEWKRRHRRAYTVLRRPNGVPVRTDRFRIGGRVRRDHHRTDGDVYLRQWLRRGVVERESYLHGDRAYLRRWASSSGTTTKLVVTDLDTGAQRRVKSITAWQVEWLESLATESKGLPVVIGESQGAVTKVARLRREAALRIGLFHNTHLEPPFRMDSDVRKVHREAFASARGLDCIVAVSMGQAAHIDSLITASTRVVTIPNPVESLPTQAERDIRLVSIVSRLHPAKGIPEAVEAFRKVVAAIPDARLEIYGRGPDQDRIRAKIDELNMNDHVHMMGRTEHPADAMSRSLCTVSTSYAETMGLAIAESALQRTPVIAYDCLFGPSELIVDGVTGRLVPVGDTDALADAIIDMLRHPDAAAKMGEAAYQSLNEHLSFETARSRWHELFESLYAARAAH